MTILLTVLSISPSLMENNVYNAQLLNLPLIFPKKSVLLALHNIILKIIRKNVFQMFIIPIGQQFLTLHLKMVHSQHLHKGPLLVQLINHTMTVLYVLNVCFLNTLTLMQMLVRTAHRGKFSTRTLKPVWKLKRIT